MYETSPDSFYYSEKIEEKENSLWIVDHELFCICIWIYYFLIPINICSACLLVATVNKMRIGIQWL